MVVRTPGRVYHANGQRVFRQKDHHSGLRHQHDRTMLILLYGYCAWSARLIANSVRDRALVFCLHPRLEDRPLLRRRLAIVLPEYARIHWISALQHSSRAVGIVTSGEVHMPVRKTRGGPAGRQCFYFIECRRQPFQEVSLLSPLVWDLLIRAANSGQKQASEPGTKQPA